MGSKLFFNLGQGFPLVTPGFMPDYYPHLSKFMQHNYLRKRQRNTRQSLSDGATTVRVFDHKDVGNSQAYRVLGVLGSGGMGDVFLLTIHVWIGK
jgi:hypothetical protein